MQTILIIEDSPQVQSLIVQTLEAAGYEVLTAENGKIGLEIARARLPDLILCDVQMPVMNGYVTLEMLQQHAATATIPFIFLTGAADKLNMRQGMELGADDYVTKPFTLDELLAAVKARLARQAVLAKQSEQKLEALRHSISFALPHEFMTPLNAITGFASLLSDPASQLAPSDVREFGQKIQGSALRLQRLIKNFVLYSQIEVLSADPEKMAAFRTCEPVLVREPISNAVLRSAQSANRESDLSLALEQASVRIGPDKLDKLVSEIADNAFKFSDPRTKVIVSGKQENQVYAFEIINHGRGMTLEQIAAVGAHIQFERKFYEQQGSGLGLIIARRLTELHGGNLHIESIPGAQTRVQIRFPASAS